MLAAAPDGVRVFGAHRLAPPGLPELGRTDALALRDALEAIRDGELPGTGFYPVVYRVNERMDLWAEPAWLQRWTPRQHAPASVVPRSKRP